MIIKQRWFRGLWRHPDFLKLWGGQSFSLFGSLVSRIALPFLVIDVLNATSVQISWVRMAELAPGMLAGLVAGVWIDRLRRRPIMIGADIARALLVASIPAALWLGHLSLWQIIVVSALLSVLTVSFDVAYEAYLPGLVEVDHLVEANSKLAGTASVAEVAGFGIGGALYQFLGGAFSLAIDAVSFVGSAITLAWIRKPEAAPQPGALAGDEGEEGEEAEEVPPSSLMREAVAGMRIVESNRVLLALAGVEGLDNLFGGFMETCYVFFVTRQLHVAEGLQGVIYGLGGLSSFIGVALAGPFLRRLGLGRSLLISSLLGLVGIALVPIGAFFPMWVVLLLLVLQQFIGDGPATIYNIQVTSLRQVVTPDGFRGRVNATWRVTGWLCQLAGVAAAGLLADRFGLLATFFLAVGLRALQLPLLYFSPVRRLRAMPGSAGPR